MKTNTLKITAGITAAMVFSSAAVFGQEPGEDDVIILDEVAAEDIPIEESILATTRPISSVYGTDRSILDTPRNVNIVSREQLDAIGIKDVRDFSKLTSSSYTKTNFGAPTTPNLRGQEADLMINGIRRGPPSTVTVCRSTSTLLNLLTSLRAQLVPSSELPTT